MGTEDNVCLCIPIPIMSRIHARTKGKSGSSKPYGLGLPKSNVSKKELEEVIQKLAQDGYSKSMIGLILRDSYGVPSVESALGKKLGELVPHQEVPEDLSALVKKLTSVKKHLEVNTRDVHNKRSKLLIVSKIRRLSKYYKQKGVL